LPFFHIFYVISLFNLHFLIFSRKESWIVKKIWKIRKKVGWIVKWYGKYGKWGKLNSDKIWTIWKERDWIVKWYRKYGRKTIQLAFLPYFPYHFTIQPSFLKYFPYFLTI
jgi:membrane protein YqaA with SNARE-associated domain